MNRFLGVSVCIVLIKGLLIFPSPAQAAELKARTVEAWQRYVVLTEARIDKELADGRRFPATEFLSKKDVAKCRKEVAAGGVYVTDLESRDSRGRKIKVPEGTISHWLGSVRIPGADLDSLISFVKRYDIHERYFDDVERSRLISRDEDTIKFFYRLKQETAFVTVHYNTTHTVRYRSHSPQRISSASRTTRIHELDNPGTDEEREKPEGKDNGFMWRLNSYWRFEQDGDGVVVTLESLTLSRGIPFLLSFVKPIVNRISRGLLENTLLALSTGYHEYILDEPKSSCEALTAEKLPHVTITSATFMQDPSGFSPPKTPGMFGTPDGLKVMEPFCRVAGFIEPVENSHIGFEIWMPPASEWNGRFLAVSNPAFEGAIKYQGLASSLERGYATASTDTGHQDPGHKWAMGQPEKLIDWVHRALHETAVTSKRLIEEFYGKRPSYSYFDGCHNGGRQGLVEAQRYPEDFDGIVAGDPAFHLTRLQTGSEYINWVALKDGVESPGFIPPIKYEALHRAALDACDALDGVKDDAIEDPTRCRFDPASIQCVGPDQESCLTESQVETARKIYAGAKFTDGTQIYSGFESGSELYWGMMIQGPEPLSINNDFFRYIAFEDPEWDFRTFDVERDTRDIDARLGSVLNNTSTDLNAFKENGGKLLVYQSWGETWIPPRTITGYYDRVVEAMGGANETGDFFRLFMVPDFYSCPGMFPDTFDALGALEKWREEGIAPDHIRANYRSGDQVRKTRPVCAYPDVAIYAGEGDVNKAENYRCGKPTW